MQITSELLELYRKLIEEIYIKKDFYKEKELNLFTPGMGKAYNNKLLIVGRAVNGWRIYIDKTNNESKDLVLREVKKRFY